MKPIRIVVLALEATLIMSAVLTANALAVEAELVNKVGNALVKDHFSATSGAVTIETTGGNKVQCASSKSTGVITSKTAGEETVTFAGCEDVGVKCNSEGQGKGVVFFSYSMLFVRNIASGLLQLWRMYLFFGKNSTIDCFGLNEELTGGFLTEVGKEQEKSLKTSYKFTAKQEKGKQIPIEYENEKKEKIVHTLEVSGKEERAGQALTQEVIYEEAAEFRP